MPGSLVGESRLRHRDTWTKRPREDRNKDCRHVTTSQEAGKGMERFSTRSPRLLVSRIGSLIQSIIQAFELSGL